MSNENSGSHTMLTWAIRELLGALPANRDWLNPDAERELRAFLATPAQPIAPAADVSDYTMAYQHGYQAGIEMGKAMAADANAPTDERAEFEALEISRHEESHNRPLTDDEKKYVLRPANSILASEGSSYEACQARWEGFQWGVNHSNARLAARAAAPVSGQGASIEGDQEFMAKMLDYRTARSLNEIHHAMFQVVQHIDSRPRSEDSRAKVLGEEQYTEIAEKVMPRFDLGLYLNGEVFPMAPENFRTALDLAHDAASTPPKADNEN